MKRPWTTGLWATGLVVVLGGCDKAKEPSKPVEETPTPVAKAPLPARIPGVPDEVKTLPSSLDQKLLAARTEAMNHWEEFETSFRNPPRFSQHSVKVAMPVVDAGGAETHQVWLWVTAIDGETISGKLANAPAKNIGLRANASTTIKKADVEDWLIFIPPDTQIGGYSVKVIQEYEKDAATPK